MDINHFFYSMLVILNEMSPYILFGFLVAGILHAFVRPEVMSRHLSGPGWRPVVKAALFGVPLPLCSCGVLPTAVSLRRNGGSKAAATSFLIATPQTGVDSIAATWSLLGPAFAVIRPFAALLGGVLGGLSVDRWDREKEKSIGPASDNRAGVSTECDNSGGACCGIRHDDSQEILGNHPAGFWQKSREALSYGFGDMVASVGKWLIIGLIIAAAITAFMPEEWLVSLGRYPLLAMLAMVVIAVPMYVCATGSIPIALSLMLKGLTPGVGFVLLMAGPAANFASVMVLSREMGRRTTALYVGTVVVTAIAIGLAIDYLMPAGWFGVDGLKYSPECHHEFGWFSLACSALLVLLLVRALMTPSHHHHTHHSLTENSETNINPNENYMKEVYHVIGMACPHCRKRVEEGLAALPGVESVVVDLGAATATVEGNATRQDIENAIRSLGYDLKE